MDPLEALKIMPRQYIQVVLSDKIVDGCVRLIKFQDIWLENCKWSNGQQEDRVIINMSQVHAIRISAPQADEQEKENHIPIRVKAKYNNKQFTIK